MSRRIPPTGPRAAWAELDALADEYYALLEEINQHLVDLGPLTISEPVVSEDYGYVPAHPDSGVIIGHRWPDLCARPGCVG